MTPLEMRVKEIVESKGNENSQWAFVNEIGEGAHERGAVPEIHRYVCAKEWYFKYRDDIEKLRKDFEETAGFPLNVKDDDYLSLAWYSFGEVVARLYIRPRMYDDD